MATSVKNNFMPPNFVSNLSQALKKRNNVEEDKSTDPSSSSVSSKPDHVDEEDGSKPRILVTNGDGIGSIGLSYLVQALVKEGLYNVYVCAPQLEKSVSGHSVTFGETVAVSSVEMNGATAYEVLGTPVDCVSLALSGALFSWSKPMLVVSGINRGSTCGHHMFYSGVVAGAREALISGVPSLSLSLNWKKDQSQESDFKDAASLSMTIIKNAIKDVENGVFPKRCGLSVQIPTSPSMKKGFKVTRPSSWRSTLFWQATPTKRHPSAGYMSNQYSIGIQLAQLGRDASAAGAARRVTTQKKNLEIESVGVAGKCSSDRAVKKYFRLQFVDKDQDEMDEDMDVKALENNFVAITPISISPYIEPEIHTAAADWIASCFKGDQ